MHRVILYPSSAGSSAWGAVDPVPRGEGPASVTVHQNARRLEPFPLGARRRREGRGLLGQVGVVRRSLTGAARLDSWESEEICKPRNLRAAFATKWRRLRRLCLQSPVGF